ncbi:hypothetical protein [Mycolicibacterium sp.]
MGDPRCRTVKGILVAGTDTGDTTAAGLPLPPALLRGPHAFDTDCTA